MPLQTGNSGTCLYAFRALYLLIMSNAEISVLSAGAVQPGMVKVIDAFRHETGHEVKVAFATAPAILKRIDGETPDVVIAPPAVLDELVKAGKATPADRVTVGRIGVGLMVRDGAPLPKIATVDEFKQSLLSAESVVYNQASTGIYLEKLFERLGIAEHLKTKTVRYPDAAAVLDTFAKARATKSASAQPPSSSKAKAKVSNSSGRYRQKSKTTRLTPPPS